MKRPLNIVPIKPFIAALEKARNHPGASYSFITDNSQGSVTINPDDGGIDIVEWGIQTESTTEEFNPRKNITMNDTSRPAVMKFFAYSQLPEHLQKVSKPFGELAETILEVTNPGAEQSTALRKLLEAKDAAVRAAL